MIIEEKLVCTPDYLNYYKKKILWITLYMGETLLYNQSNKIKRKDNVKWILGS